MYDLLPSVSNKSPNHPVASPMNLSAGPPLAVTVSCIGLMRQSTIYRVSRVPTWPSIST